MAVALVQSVHKRETATVNSSTQAFGVNVTAGNAIIVTGQHYIEPATNLSMTTDSLGNTYNGAVHNEASQHISWAGGSARINQHYAMNIAGGANTVTYDIAGTGTGSVGISFTIAEWSGLATSAMLEQTVVNTSPGSPGSSTPSSGNTTSTAIGNLVVGCMTYDGFSSTMTAAGGYTQLQEDELAPVHTEYLITTGAGVTAATWALTQNRIWVAHAAVYLAASGGGGGALAIPVLLRQYRARRS
jgi:hypothetical protein